MGKGVNATTMWFFYIGMALATLTKGPIGFLIPMLAVGLYLWLTRSWSLFWRQGFPVAGLTAVPAARTPLVPHDAEYSWTTVYDLGARRHDRPFLRRHGRARGHAALLSARIPARIFSLERLAALRLVPGLSKLAGGTTDRRTAAVSILELRMSQPYPHALEWFAAAWVLGGLVFFSLSSTRLPHYIGPLFPAAAILTASYWNRCVTDHAAPNLRAAIHTMTAVGYILALAFASLPPLYAKFAGN